jgi:hypothetical protein
MADVPLIFISCSHKDAKWKNKLEVQFRVLARDFQIKVWSDREIVAGDEWLAEINQAIDAAQVAVLLISADYLASEFLLSTELPRLLERRERYGMLVIPILVRPCDWHAVSWLSMLQILPRDGKALSERSPRVQDRVLSEAVRAVRDFIARSTPTPVDEPPETPPNHRVTPEPHADALREASSSFTPTTDRTFYSIDSPADSDLLDRRHLAHALSYLLDEVHEEQSRLIRANRGYSRFDPMDSAFLVNLHGRWGSGKSSVLNFPKQRLQDPSRDRPWIVIELNAWQHQRFSVPWWSILSELYSQSLVQLRRTRKPNRSVVQFRELTWRFKSRWGTFLIAIAGLLWLLAYASLGIAEGKPQEDWLKRLGDILQIIAGSVTAWAAITSFGNFILLGSARTAKLLTDLRKDPMQPMIEHFGDLVASVWYPIVFFIEDVDRCDDVFVVDLLQTIQTLYRRAPVIYVVAADRHWINRSYHTRFAGFADDYREPGRSLGDLFLEKIFQISISIPSVSQSL